MFSVCIFAHFSILCRSVLRRVCKCAWVQGVSRVAPVSRKPLMSEFGRLLSICSLEHSCESVYVPYWIIPSKLLNAVILGLNYKMSYNNLTIIIRYCRMTNYELLHWLVETPSHDVEHYRMLNMSAVDRGDITMTTGSHYNVTPGDRKAVTWPSLNTNIRYILRRFCLHSTSFLFTFCFALPPSCRQISPASILC